MALRILRGSLFNILNESSLSREWFVGGLLVVISLRGGEIFYTC